MVGSADAAPCAPFLLLHSQSIELLLVLVLMSEGHVLTAQVVSHFSSVHMEECEAKRDRACKVVLLVVSALYMVLEFISSIKLPLAVDSQAGELALAFVLLHVSLEIVNPPVRAWSRSPRILETDVALVGPFIYISTLH